MNENDRLDKLEAELGELTWVVAGLKDAVAKLAKGGEPRATREPRKTKKRRYWKPVEKRLVQWFKMRAGRSPLSHEELLFVTMWATDWRDDPQEADRRQREARRYFIAECFNWRCPVCDEPVKTLKRWVFDLREFSGRCDDHESSVPMVRIPVLVSAKATDE